MRKRNDGTDHDFVENLILVLQKKRAILDADLARLYGVSTKRLNEQVKRNRHRFPDDFAFAVSRAERDELVAKCDRFRMLKHSAVLPTAFTELGAVMAANVLNSEEAVRTSIFVVRAFVKMREVLSAGVEIGRKLSELERRLDGHDDSIKEIIAAIRGLAIASPRPARRIGFSAEGNPGGTEV
ncbi:MAG: ORF6N domain-containing protein [Proteobacteria bacterium]|jgi:hypothetical protein|nr:ORF6N domain-containing protein [Pseudomonadota bacterium]